MDRPKGRVVALNTDPSGRSVAIVDVDAAVACARCAAGKGCGAGLFAAGGRRRVEAKLPPSVEVGEGDTVLIDLEGHNLLPAALIVYGWPLAGAAAGSLLAALGPWTGDAATAAGALLGLVTAGFLARRRLRSAHCIERFQPVIIERAGSAAG